MVEFVMAGEVLVVAMIRDTESAMVEFVMAGEVPVVAIIQDRVCGIAYGVEQ
jgi:hypothetical protein